MGQGDLPVPAPSPPGCELLGGGGVGPVHEDTAHRVLTLRGPGTGLCLTVMTLFLPLL